MTFVARWLPAALLLAGAFMTVGVDIQREMPLEAPLNETIPVALAGFAGQDQVISDEELRVVGVSDYLFRVYEPGETSVPAAPEPASTGDGAEDAASAATTAAPGPFTLYVGFYEQQSRGKTIHSPKNCLPGAGWEALTSTTREIDLGGRSVTVNQYLIKRETQQALVLYWYQGRGRIEANEYRVKFDLLKDSALRGRSDEALVRLVVPVTESQERAAEIAERAAVEVIPAVDEALPA